MTDEAWFVCKQTTLLGFIPWSKYLVLSPPAVTPLGTMNFRGWTSWQSQATRFRTPGEAANNVVRSLKQARRVGALLHNDNALEYVKSSYSDDD